MLSRPDPEEHTEYYGLYVGQVTEGDILELMSSEMAATQALLASMSTERETFRYQPEKWSIREVVGHMVDVERVFSQRALWFAREAADPLPGMEQDDWAAVSNAHDRPLTDLAAELAATRSSNRAMFAGFDAEIAMRRGIASDCPFTVRSIAYILVGHEIHHRRVLRERYL